ncbi:hypothetical protein HZF05_17365 [Sphingomonas sp. CGMCC 1.13654]|uniref:Uncharacterized protein n=1 Tax=Sphingomonas chungangi TaxID=2683589 RepID=A0A838LAI8_9SPHN|nr:hypothetical protein [Sphingomonas chungangi]MBA2935852.1 hypothetical protein [Sphingomonas chungangi]MVW54543.1 hypothetical protein [Sphingomonas chungangi]
MRVVLGLVAGGLLIAAAPAPKVQLAPADDKPAQPVGAAARQKNGPEPLAVPPADAGSAEDPAPAPGTPAQLPLPPEPKPHG